MQKISFAELAAQPQVDGRVPITCDLQPPPTVDAERAYLNASTLRFLSRCAGFSELHIGFDANTQANVNVAARGVSGVNPDGSAMGWAAGARAKSANPNVTLDDDPTGGQTQFWRPAVRIGVERGPFGAKVADQKRVGNSLDAAWATELDHQIRRGVIIAAGRALLMKAPAGLVVGTGEIGLLASEGLTVYTAAVLSALQLASAVPGFFRSDIDVKNFKPNIVGAFGFQPDRFVTTALAAAFGPRIAGLHRQKSKDE